MSEACKPIFRMCPVLLEVWPLAEHVRPSLYGEQPTVVKKSCLLQEITVVQTMAVQGDV